MAKAKQEAQVNKSSFLKSLNKKKTAAKAAAKSERPQGILDDNAIMQRLGLDAPGDSVTLDACVSAIKLGFAKKDQNRPYLSFMYSITSNSPHTNVGKGLIVSNYHELTEASNDKGEVWRTEEEAFEQLFFEFQGIGETTTDWQDPLSEAVDTAEKLTKDKTALSITLSVYEKKRDKSLGLNVRPNPINVDNSDLDEDEDNDEGNEEEDSYADWVGYEVVWKDDEGEVTFEVASYDEQGETFTGKDSEDDEYTAPCDECTIVEEEDED